MNLNILFLLAPLFLHSPADYYYGIHGNIQNLKTSIPIQNECLECEFNMYILNWKKGEKEYHYLLTETDILNLMRAVYKEGPDETAVAFTLLTRFAWIYPNYLSFSEFVKNYAQPINPKWFPNGSKFKSYIKTIKDNNTKKLLIQNAKLRVKYSKYSKVEIDVGIVELIYDILNNNKINPVTGSVHFIFSSANKNDSEETARQKQLEFANSHKHVDKPIYYKSSKSGNNWFFTANKSDNFKINIIKKNGLISSSSILMLSLIGAKYLNVSS
jgi:hypothetical protein